MKRKEQVILEFKCALEALITEREGMIADNMQRQACGESMAYGSESFITLTSQIEEIRESIISLGKK